MSNPLEALANNAFTYHKPFGDQSERYEKIRALGLETFNKALHVALNSQPQTAEQELYDLFFTMSGKLADLVNVNGIEAEESGRLAARAMESFVKVNKRIYRALAQTREVVFWANANIACNETHEPAQNDWISNVSPLGSDTHPDGE